eukprot:768301-Pleurochrysis_carterae.AAC.3
MGDIVGLSDTFYTDAEVEDVDEQDDPSCDGYVHEDKTSRTGVSKPKLWGKDQFPEKVKGVCNYEMANPVAAQEWRCPCKDRSCLLTDHIKTLELYKHRKSFHLTANARGGKRDALSSMLVAHYSIRWNILPKFCCRITQRYMCGCGGLSVWLISANVLRGPYGYQS